MDAIREAIEKELAQARQSGKEPAFLFDRISSTRQTDGISLDQQSQGGYAYAERNGLHVVYAFMIVESAYHENRKHLMRVLNMAEEYGVKNLIFKNADRLSRNISHANKFRELFEEKGFTFHFYELNQRINAQSTYDEKWMFYFFILMAQRLSMKLSHDSKEVYKYKVAKGIPHHKPPDGYVWNREKRLPVIDIKREPVLRMVFDTYDAGGYSLDALCDHLNGKGFATSTGRAWRKSNLHFILTNQFYCGEFVFHGEIYQGNYETYFDRARFDDRLKRMNTHPGKGGCRSYHLTRLLRCASCGSMLYGDMKKGKYVYYTHKCLTDGAAPYIPEARIFEQIDAAIVDYAITDEYAAYLKRAFLESITMKERSQTADLAAITHRITGLEAKQKKLLDLYTQDGIPGELLRSKISDYQKEIEYLETQRRDYRIDKTEFIVKASKLVEMIQKFTDIYLHSTPESKGEILRPIVSRITIGDHAEITFKEPFSILLTPKLRAVTRGVPENSPVLPQSDEYRTVIEDTIRRIWQWAA